MKNPQPEEASMRIPAAWGGFVEFRDLDPEKWPADIRDLVDVVGMAHTIALCERFGGCQVYFPKLESLVRSARNSLIRKLFDGANHKELAARFRMTGSSIRSLLARGE
jgi:Mor family transcriptional regulator